MKNLLVILGPTASGKTRLGVTLARDFGAEILSVDSRQIYRGLDIGSGKDLAEYGEGGTAVPHHLIDIVDLKDEFNVFAFQKVFFETFEHLAERGTPAIAVGGSGLYLEAALSKYRMVEVPENPALREVLADRSTDELGDQLRGLQAVHNTTDLQDRSRLIRAIEIAEYARGQEAQPAPAIESLVLGVRWDHSVLRRRIRERLNQRLNTGLIEEVQTLHDRGVPWEKLRFLGLEYRFVSDFLRGRIRNRNDLQQKLASAIKAFAKRQETWFRRMERRGVEIHWIEGADVDRAREIIAGCGGLRPGSNKGEK